MLRSNFRQLFVEIPELLRENVFYSLSYLLSTQCPLSVLFLLRSLTLKCTGAGATEVLKFLKCFKNILSPAKGILY